MAVLDLKVDGVEFNSAMRTAVAGALDVAPEALTADVDLSDELLDDIRATSLLVAVEEAFDVRLPDDFLDGIVTYGQLARAVWIALPV